MTHLIETIVGLAEKGLQGGALLGVVDNKTATGAYGAEKLLQDLRAYKEGKLDKAEVAGQAINALTDLGVTGFLEAHGCPAPIAKTIGLVMSWLAERLVEGIAHGVFKTTTPTDKALDKVKKVEEAKGNIIGNSVHGVGTAIHKAANVADVLPLGSLLSVPTELASTGVKVAGDVANLNVRSAAHDLIEGGVTATARGAELLVPFSRDVNAGIGLVTGTSVTTGAGKVAAHLLTGSNK